MEGLATPDAANAPRGRRLLVGLIALALPLLLYRLGAKDLWEASDARPLESAREMRVHGDALVQYTNGEVDLTKPPVYAWLAGAAFRLFGRESEGVGRLPSVFASLLILCVTFAFARRAAGPRAGFLAGLLLLTTARFLWQARLSDFETLLGLGVVVAYLALDAALRAEPGAARGRAFALFHAATGFAFAVKGPVALLLVWPGALAAAVVASRVRALFSAAAIATLPLLAIVGLPWYVAVVLRDRGALDAFLSFGAGDNVGHLQPPWFYLWNYPLNALPWSPLVLLGFFGALPKPSDPAGGSPTATAAAGFVATFLVMSIVHPKQSHYLIPIYPLGAVLAGVWLDGFLSRRGVGAGRAVRLVLAVWAVACLVAVGHVLPAKNSERSARAFMENVDRTVPAGSPLAWTVFGSHSDYLWYLGEKRVGARGIPELVGKDEGATVARVSDWLAEVGPRYAIVTGAQADALSPQAMVLVSDDRFQRKERRLALVTNLDGFRRRQERKR